VDFLKVLDADMGVALRRSEAGMTEHLLNRTEVGSVIEQMSGERMAQAVGRNPGDKLRPIKAAGDDLLDAARGDTAAPKIGEDGTVEFPCNRHPATPLSQRFEGRYSDRHNAVLVALA
jgi:hypothetical protein